MKKQARLKPIYYIKNSAGQKKRIYVILNVMKNPEENYVTLKVVFVIEKVKCVTQKVMFVILNKVKNLFPLITGTK